MLSVRFLGLKLARFVATLFLVTFFTTWVLTLVPGSPAAAMCGENCDPATLKHIEQAYNFDKPVLQQYVTWLGHAVHGDLGRSYFTRQPVMDSITQRLPVTLELAVLAMALALAVVIPVSIACATKPDGLLDRTVTGLVYVMLAVPIFVVGLVLAWVFAVQLGVLPLLGWVPLQDSVMDNLRSAALPVIAISLGLMAGLSRVLRADLIRTTQEDYIALARSKGVSTRKIMWKHALKPSSFSLLTIAGIQLAYLIGGTIIVEQIFALPGIGQLLLSSISQKDFPVVTGLVAFIAVAFLTINLIVDLLYGVLDPRTRNVRVA
jgi:peptide/nickel transport system permease protein